jgi:hypothetical protein
MNLELSRRLALLGMIPFIADTIRRWHQLGDLKIWPFWLDDFLLGGFLLYGAWLTGKDVKKVDTFWWLLGVLPAAWFIPAFLFSSLLLINPILRQSLLHG